MNLANLELHQIFLIVNFLVSFLLLIYGFYLANIEKNYRKKHDQLENLASQIIQEANKKALNILKDSDYLSDELKKEIDGNFDVILGRLQEESKGFYKSIENEYVKSTSKFAEEIQKRAEQELDELEAAVENRSVDAEEKFQQVYVNELNEAKQHIENYKEEKTREIEKVLTNKISELATELLTTQISIQDQEKLVSDIINRAYSEGVFKE